LTKAAVTIAAVLIIAVVVAAFGTTALDLAKHIVAAILAYDYH
jgi:hypothetical protein